MKVKDVQHGKTTRKSFARIEEILEMPNLIEVQKKSYEWFLAEGLREVFADAASITDYTGNLELSFLDYTMDEEPKYSIEECKARDATYATPLKVRMRLRNKETGEIKEQEIFMGDFPKMTDSATFIINGAERAIVSQLVRSPGVYYGKELDKTDKVLLSTTVIPYRGAWLEYETDANDIFYVRIDKNRKIPITSFIRAIGVKTDSEIKELFGEDPLLLATLDKDPAHSADEALIEIYKKMRPGEPPSVESATSLMDMMFFDMRRYDISAVGRYKYNKKLDIARRIAGHKLLETVTDPLTGEVVAEADTMLNREKATEISRRGINNVVVESTDGAPVKVFGNGMVFVDDFSDYLGGMTAEELGVKEKVRFTVLKEIIESGVQGEELKKVFKSRHIDLIPKTIIVDDMLASICYLLNLSHGIGTVDDIDHLGNRRLRCVGELLQNQVRIGFSRMERVIRERMTIQDLDVVTPQSLINIRPVTAAIKEFFGSSPLSQFMDQNNPLAELTHKRRMSALGPGGLSRDRAGFEVRDVHYTHYGRLCPIETPEGPNIGLISYLATYAKINKYGFVEAPYRKVDKATGTVTDEVVYMTADEEDEYIVAQANEPLDENNHFVRPRVSGRHRNDIQEFDASQVDYMDVSPRMMVSVATACIPFLENDDCNRALMGSNMQRQAVPLMVTQQPLVATGMEYKAATDSGVCVLAAHDGTVEYVDADKIIVRCADGSADTYELIKFMRSNQGNCNNQRPIVNVGETVKAGDVLADGPATRNGEISLGKNALIGFMTWEGYNYEDAVLLNEKLVREDVYTSIHIEEYETEARDTKLGPEEITRDIPNVGDDALKDLDDRGIIRIGAEVKTGDILVGKVTPKGETELTAEERLLRAIFGEKAREVRDTSLRVPHGAYGIVVDVKVFTPENSDELQPGVRMCVRCYIAQKRKISVGDKMAGRHGNKGVVSRILPQEDMPFLPDGTPLDIVLNPLGVPSRMNIGQVLEVNLGYVAKALGWKVQTPVFDGAHESDLRDCFAEAREKWHGENAPEYPTHLDRLMGEKGHVIDFSKIDLTDDGKTTLYDGRTGEQFPSKVTVGYMYYLKLHHLVDDKIHARSTGPYSMVTQQPLGGKAQFGGQRFGEMEVWALEAYGAAYTLQEILTIKSDDVVGRVKTYEAIVKGEPIPRPGIPESFRVMLKELQSLGLDIVVQDKEGNAVDMRQEFDDDDSSFENNDYDLGDNVMVESELQDDYSVKDADEGFDDDLDEDAGPTADDLAAIESDSFDD